MSVSVPQNHRRWFCPSASPLYLNEPTIRVPNFNSVTPFIKGTDLITTQLSAMQYASLKGLAWAPLPVSTEPLQLSLLWHKRYEDDPAHQWLREQILDTVKSISGDLPLKT